MSKRIARPVTALGLLAVISFGAFALTGNAAARPEPDCGPTFSWDCTMPNGSHQFVEGTRCEIAAFQKQTGARCVIAPW
jgi:hypothetical protein